MLRFAFVAGLAGLGFALVLGALALAHAPLAGHSALHITLFISIFVSFVPAVLGHPARKWSGSEVSVSLWTVVRSAAPWTVVLFALSFVACIVAGLALGGDEFSVNDATLAGRSDRQIFIPTFCAVFHATAVMIASSGLGWDWVLSLPPGSTKRLALSHEGATTLTYRASDQRSFWQILAEVGVALFIWHRAKTVLADTPPLLRHAGLLLFLVPVAHITAKLFGHVTISVVGQDLVLRHFPYFFRNRRVRISDIDGIQLNAERDREGEITHYSLLVIGLGLTSDRLVHYVPEAEQANELAQRIDALIAPVRSK